MRLCQTWCRRVAVALASGLAVSIAAPPAGAVTSRGVPGPDLHVARAVPRVVCCGGGGGYDGAAAAAYADKYNGWPYQNTSRYNQEYANYGADCTNFASQALFNGGLPWVPENDPPESAVQPTYSTPGLWFEMELNDPNLYESDGYDETAIDWINAPSLFDFLTSWSTKYSGDSTPWGSLDFSWGYWTHPGQLAPSTTPPRPGDVFFYNLYDMDNGQGPRGIDHATVMIMDATTSRQTTDGTTGDAVDQHTYNLYHVFWTLKYAYGQDGSWKTESIFGVHVNPSAF